MGLTTCVAMYKGEMGWVKMWASKLNAITAVTDIRFVRTFMWICSLKTAPCTVGGQGGLDRRQPRCPSCTSGAFDTLR